MKFKLINGMIHIEAFVEGKLGVKELSAVVDTAASMTTIDTQILDDLGYSARNGDDLRQVFTAAEANKQGYTIKIKKFETCGIVSNDLKVLVFGLLNDPEFSKVDCLIGTNFLRHFKIIINYKMREIYFEDNK